MAGGSVMDRATINKQQFVECPLPMQGGGVMAGSKIGSSATVLNVKSWTPDQDDDGVPHGHTVKANIEAINTELQDVHYDEGNDFLATGIFDDVAVVEDDLNLVTSPEGDDFEGYTIGQNPLGNGWTARTTDTSWTIQQEVSGDSQHARGYGYDDESVMVLDSAGDSTDVIVEARIRFPESSDNPQAGVTARITGAGLAMRGYCAYIARGQTSLNIKRFIGDGVMFGLYTPAIPVVVENQWYRIKLRCVGSGISAKVWKEGDAEPGYQGVDNTSHPGPGASGVFYRSKLATRKALYDDFLTETYPPIYVSSGDWEDEVDVTAAEHYSHGLISWDETTPTDTTAVVKARWRDTDAWVAQTNGERITGIGLGDDMRAGSSRDTLKLRVELASTDASVTPSVSNLRVYFEPLDRDQVEIVVHGAANILADNTLLDWGMAWLRPGTSDPYVEVKDWSDLWFQTVKRWMARDLQAVTAALNYWGNAIESITFEAEASKYRHGYEPCEWVVPALVMTSGPTLYEWTALKTWWPMGHNFEWLIIDKGQAIHADYRWMVGHLKINDTVGMVIPGVSSVRDHIGSLLAKAYRLDNYLGQTLVQGWRFDNAPGMVMVAERFYIDTVGSILLGAREMTSVPGMFLLYAVNRDGAVFVNVIDDDTYQALLDEGITFS